MRRLLATFCLVCTSLTLNADYNGPCCGSQSCWDSLCCGSYEVFGYALYMKPSSCNRKFVIEDNGYFGRLNAPDLGTLFVAPVGSAAGRCPDFDWGFRVGIGYVPCGECVDVRAYYTRLCTTDSQTLALGNRAGVLWPERVPAIQLRWQLTLPTGAGSVLTNPDQAGTTNEFGAPALAQARTRFEWDAVDGEIAARTVKCCDLFLRGHLGIEWTRIRREGYFYYQGTSLDTNNSASQATNVFIDTSTRTEAWGIGPRIGFDIRYHVLCGFGLTAHAGAAVLAGEVSAAQTSSLRIVTQMATASTASQTLFDARWPANCALFPEFDGALGLSYEWCCWCLRVIGEVGYEFRTYIHPLGAEFFFDEESAASASVCDPFNLQGLYFGLLLRY